MRNQRVVLVLTGAGLLDLPTQLGIQPAAQKPTIRTAAFLTTLGLLHLVEKRIHHSSSTSPHTTGPEPTQVHHFPSPRPKVSSS
ncbi:hypothetical protein PI124_g12558 [Phytophthora idaei]|nr:hypothetical protein PI126_g11335 [Phytophthora idaei]KAG3242597.1 hypothetical protein PI124_g12558 [Phytophthora idaei]